MILGRRKKRGLYEVEEDPRLLSDDDAPKPEEKRGEYFFRHVYLGLAIVALSFVARLSYLTLAEGAKNTELAEGNRIREEVIRAPRGLILDRKGKILAQNDANFELLVTPGDLPDDERAREELYTSIANLASVDRDLVKQKSESRGFEFYQPVLVKQGVDRNIALNMEAESNKYPGFKVEVNPIRQYRRGAAFSHVIGYVGRVSEEDLKAHPDYLYTDFIGKEGIEKQYESELRGTHGARIVEVDVLGRVVRTIGPPREPVAGKSIKLTIDYDLQLAAQQALARSLARAKKSKGAVVAIDPRNGEVLALVSRPSYNNNLFARGISDKQYSRLIKNKNNPLYSRAVLGTYPSGSTIKPFMASAGLQEKVISPSTAVRSTGGLKVKDQFFPDYMPGGHGYTNLNRAISQSVNTYFYILGGGQWKEDGTAVIKQGLGVKRINKYLKNFGFGRKTGIDLPDETAGLVPSPEWKRKTKSFDCTPGATAQECWYLGDTYNLSIGQGDIGVTPLQMAAALSGIANGGKLYEPQLMKSAKAVYQKIGVSRGNLAFVRRAMRETVVSGSGRALSGLAADAAGKTGTAQFGPDNEYKHAWFVSFAPWNSPRIAIVVLAEGAGEGHEFAVPVAKEMLKNYFR